MLLNTRMKWNSDNITPSTYKPLQIKAPPPPTRNAKKTSVKSPLQILAPGDLFLEIALKYKVKQSKNGKFPSNYKLTQLILKRIFPSVHKPLQIKAPPPQNSKRKKKKPPLNRPL